MEKCKEEVFLGRSVARQQNMSEETAKKADSEIRKIVDQGYDRARKVLTDKIDDLHKLAKALLTYETLSGEEIENLINKNIYPADKQDLKIDDDKGSALSSYGLKTKNCSFKRMNKILHLCKNFYFTKYSRFLIEKRNTPLHGQSDISFSHVKIIFRNKENN